jgi:hypothetical protein
VPDFIRQVREAGAKRFAHSMALAEHRHGEALTTKADSLAGTASAIAAAAEPDARALVF